MNVPQSFKYKACLKGKIGAPQDYFSQIGIDGISRRCIKPVNALMIRVPGVEILENFDFRLLFPPSLFLKAISELQTFKLVSKVQLL